MDISDNLPVSEKMKQMIKLLNTTNLYELKSLFEKV